MNFRGFRGIFVFAVPLAVLTGCSGDDSPDIVVGTVERATVTEVVEAPGNVTAKATATLTAPADGRVAELRVADGDEVTAGQVLLRIDSPSAEERLREAKEADAEVADAGQVSIPPADLSATRRRSDRAARDAFETARDAAEGIPDPALREAALAQTRQAEAEYAAARAEARAAVRRFNAGLGSLSDALSSLTQAQRVQTRAAVSAAQRVVDGLVVEAPISGVVSLRTGAAEGGAGDLSELLGELPSQAQGDASRFLGGEPPGGGAGGGGDSSMRGPITEGAPVSAGGPLATVIDVSALSLTAEVDETDVLLVRRGVEADVEFDAVPGASYSATVTSVDLTPTTSSRGGVSYRVRLALGGGTLPEGDPAPRPRPGMSAVVDLNVRTAEEAVAVPASAVIRDGRHDTVFAVVDGRAERRRVNLGAQGEAMVQVISGVEAGEPIVVRGADQVREGQSVS